MITVIVLPITLCFWRLQDLIAKYVEKKLFSYLQLNVKGLKIVTLMYIMVVVLSNWDLFHCSYDIADILPISTIDICVYNVSHIMYCIKRMWNWWGQMFILALQDRHFFFLGNSFERQYALILDEKLENCFWMDDHKCICYHHQIGRYIYSRLEKM